MQLVKAVICFVGIWIFVSILRSYLGGWMNLARSYRVSTRRGSTKGVGRMWLFHTAYMRWLMVYGNALILRSDPRGLRISVLPLFRIGHPPLLIPWNDISVVAGKGLFKPFVELRFEAAPSIPLRMGASVYRGVVGAIGREAL